jgi:hypothetical protein
MALAIEQRVHDQVYGTTSSASGRGKAIVTYRYFRLEQLGWTVEQGQAFADQLNEASGDTRAIVTFDGELAIDADLCRSMEKKGVLNA